MAFELSWVIPSRVLLIEVEGVIPTDELLRLVAEVHTHVDAGQAPVHMLIDATNLINRPINLQELSQLSKSMNHESIGWSVMVKPAKMIWFATSILSKLMQKKMKSAESIEDALIILQRVDFTLDAQLTLPLPN